MSYGKKALAKNVISLLLVVIMVFSCSVGTFAGTKYFQENGARYQMESLDRGLIATSTTNGVFLSWRLFKEEVTGYSSTGLTGSDFNVYKNGAKIATVADSTNYMDTAGTVSDSYFVRAVVNGAEVDKSAAVTPVSNSYIQVLMKKPANYTDTIDNLDGTTPTSLNFAYTAGDFSVGDVDGDGQYEYFVKWEGNPQDVIGKGYTGKTLIDCYKLDGTLLYRIDLGVNIREGAHYTQFMVEDFDGDGKAEIIFKTAPGTSTVHVNADGTVDEGSRKYITMLPEDITAGYSNSDDYRNTYKDYYEHVVDMFKNWQDHPEVKNGHWPATLQQCFGITTTSSGIIGGNFDALGNVVTTTYSAIGTDLLSYTYPLSDTNARILADYFINTYAPARSGNNKLKQFIGYIFTGPEYLTVFNGETGAELETIRYKPGRDDDGLMWGDYAMVRIEPCNRVERMQAEVAYLDGKKPYAIFGRGYYTRTTLVAYSWNGEHLQEYWYLDSGYPVMTNPFNDSPHGRDGTVAGFEDITTQGSHTMVDADVDGDGRDELIMGGATIDDDGSVLYSSFATISQGPNAGTYARLGHGDSIHVTDIIPSRPGQEILMCHEGATGAPYGVSMRDAKTGEVLWGTYRDKDNGRCMIGDIDPALPGIENWSMALRQGDAAGTQISTSMPGTNANIKWAANMTTQIVNGSGVSDVTIQRWNTSTKKSEDILTAAGYNSNNGTKGNPSLVADVLGDYREELILRSAASDNFRIYFNSSEVSNHKLFTLMDDRQYRTGVARQNDGYNQPAYTSFYYASDINWENLYNSVKDSIISSTDVTLVNEDFSQYAPGPVTIGSGNSWTKEGTAPTMTVTESAIGWYANIAHKTTGSSYLGRRFTPQYDGAVLDFDINVPGNSGGSFFVMNGKVNATNSSLVRAKFTGGKFTKWDNTPYMNYDTSHWYHFNYVFNIPQKTYTLTITDLNTKQVNKFAPESFFNSVNALSSFAFSTNASTGEWNVANVRLVGLDISLKSLKASFGLNDLNVTPMLSTSISTHTVDVPYSVGSISVIPTVSNLGNVQLKVEGVEKVSGTPSTVDSTTSGSSISISVGSLKYPDIVRTYSLVVNKLQKSPDVKNIKAQAGDTKVSIGWDEPLDPDLVKTNVYRVNPDSSLTLVDSVPKGKYISTVNDLENGTVYSFTVKAAYEDTSESTGVTVSATPMKKAARQLEELDRGLVAVVKGSGVYLGWRKLGTDPENVAFNIYRNGGEIAQTLAGGSTNYVDAQGTSSSSYYVCPVINSIEQKKSETVTVWNENYLTIPLNKPADGIIPEHTDLAGAPVPAESYKYRANDATVADLDGDGQYEIVLKWDPTNSKDNSIAGYTGNTYVDAYEMDGTFLWRIDCGVNIRSGAHYLPIMVYDLDGDGKAEVVFRTANGTTDDTGKVLGDHPTADYRNANGYILDGMEYLTVFEGATGKELQTVEYNPPRGDVGSWGSNETYGNRVDRFLASIAYLDGERPSVIMQRGYYNKTILVAYNWRDDDKDGKSELTQLWKFDSTEPGNSAYEGQGNHQVSVADVDADGKDEILLGSAAIDNDGKPMWTASLGHGDAMHVGDLNPEKLGLEEFDVHEDTSKAYSANMYDAETGRVLWGLPQTGFDTGRGLATDVDPRYPGAEAWAISGEWNSTKGYMFNSEGKLLTNDIPSANFAIWWDGDLLRELFDHVWSGDPARVGIPKIDKWDYLNNKLVNLETFSGTYSNNDTKGNPCLQADILGDWREELLLRTEDSTALRLYTTTEPTEYGIYTLMHDSQYRTAVAWQNSGYNQPPHTSFFLGNGMNAVPKPNIYMVTDKSRLDKLITDAAALNEVYYTPGTWAALKTALDGAVLVQSDAEATVIDINYAINAIQNAINGLISTVNLNAKISLAQTLYNADTLGDAVKANLKTALDAAVAVQDNDNAAQADMDSKVTALQSAIDAALSELPASERIVSASANYIPGGTVTGSGIYHEGDSATVTASPLSGFKFANWTQYDILSTTAPGLVATTEASYSFIVGTTSASLVAYFIQDASAWCTVTFDKNGGDSEASPAAKSVMRDGNIGTLPTPPTRTGYTFNGWNTAANGSGTVVTAATVATANITVYAQWIANNNGNNNDDSNKNPTTPVVPTPPATPPVTVPTDGKITAPAVMDNSGNAKATLTEAQVNAAIDNANPATARVEIKVEVPAGAKSVETAIPASSLGTAVNEGIRAFTVSSPIATITFDAKALGTISSGITGDVKISAAKADTASLSSEAKQIVGDRPVYNFSVSGGGKTISQFGGNVTVSVPYTPKAGEDLNAIVIYYINAEGKPEVVRDCIYDAKTGSITFKTNHFSQYAVGYNKINFTDVAANAWYSKIVSFIAARGITEGTGNGKFSPEAKLTRGEFLVMAMKAYGIAPDTNTSDNFSDAGNTLYTGYLAAAKRLGLTTGTGNNRYQPGSQITRQEMFTLLYNILKQQGKLPASVTEKTIAGYSDASTVAAWAKEAMTFFVKAGVVSGNNGKLTPGDPANRAQMAQILYNLLSK